MYAAGVVLSGILRQKQLSLSDVFTRKTSIGNVALILGNSMQTQVTPAAVNSLERSLPLVISATEMEAQVMARLKQVAKTAKMSGFRPGKVPFNVVVNQYGYSVRQEVMGASVERAFVQAVTTAQMRVAGQPRIAAAETGANSDKYEFVATFEVFPEVKVGDLSTQKLLKPIVSVGDADVDHTISTLRKQRAKFEATTRAAQNGDFVKVDFVGKLNGEVFAGGEAKDFSVVLGEGRMLPDFEAAIVGMKPAQEKTFDLTFPADYKEELAGKTVQFSVTVNALSEPILPELDGEFAKSLGVENGDVSKMRGEIKANLERELKKRVEVKIKDQVMEAVIAVSDMPLPRALVEPEIGRLQAQAVEDLQRRGMTTKDLSLPADLFVERAEKRVKLGLLLNQIIADNQIKAAPDKVKAIIEEHAESYEEPEQMVKWYYSQPDRLGEVEALAIESAIVDWCAGKMQSADEVQSFDTVMGIERK
jgi:trigger factor